MLIGVLRGVPREETGFSPVEYQPKVLQRDAVLVETNTRSTLKNVLETLITYLPTSMASE